MELKNKLIKFFFKDDITVEGKNLITKLLRFKDYPKNLKTSLVNSDHLIINNNFKYYFIGNQKKGNRILYSEFPLWKKEDEYTLQLNTLKNKTEIFFSKISYFEIDILKENHRDSWQDSCISIGIGRKPDTLQIHCGWISETIGYHSDDGGIYNGQANRKFTSIERFEEGDTVGCGFMKKNNFVKYFFTKNGRIVFTGMTVIVDEDIYALVGYDDYHPIEINLGQKSYSYNLKNNIEYLF